jgi:hypothetical protein
MLTPVYGAIFCSFANEKVPYNWVEEHVLAWCATELHISQKLARIICKPLELADGRSCQLVVIGTATEEGRDK